MNDEADMITVEYSEWRKPTAEEREKIRERVNDPNILTGIDKLRAYYQKKGWEFDENIYDNIIRDYHLDE